MKQLIQRRNSTGPLHRLALRVSSLRLKTSVEGRALQFRIKTQSHSGVSSAETPDPLDPLLFRWKSSVEISSTLSSIHGPEGLLQVTPELRLSLFVLDQDGQQKTKLTTVVLEGFVVSPGGTRVSRKIALSDENEAEVVMEISSLESDFVRGKSASRDLGEQLATARRDVDAFKEVSTRYALQLSKAEHSNSRLHSQIERLELELERMRVQQAKQDAMYKEEISHLQCSLEAAEADKAIANHELLVKLQQLVLVENENIRMDQELTACKIRLADAVDRMNDIEFELIKKSRGHPLKIEKYN